MSRYLPFVKPAPPGRVVATGPTPAAHRFPLDDPARRARPGARVAWVLEVAVKPGRPAALRA